jgi:hypothetical protein
MNYEPNLYVYGADDASSKSIYQVIKDLGFGKIKYVEREHDGAYVSMDRWNMNATASTRLKLEQGKPLLLYYSDDKFWKVYAYEHRFAEEEHKKRMEKKRAIQIRREKEARRKERKEKEKQEKEAQRLREQEAEIDAMLEYYKQASIDAMEEDHYLDEHERRREEYDAAEVKSTFITVLDYGDAVDMCPIVKARAKNLRDRLKSGYKK